MNKYVQLFRSSEDINPYNHDGSYELLQEGIKLYKNVKLNEVDIEDLNLIYNLVIGTWRSSIDVKIKRIKESHLLTQDKKKLIDLLHIIDNKAKNDSYTNKYGNGKSIGMFGTGFFTFR